MSVLQSYRERQELAVQGFIRVYAIGVIIPSDLIQLCVTYFLQLMDHWNEEILCEGFEVTKDNTLNLIKTRSLLENWHTAFGTVVIGKGEIYEWNFRIITTTQLIQKAAIHIGISPFPIHPTLLIKSNDAIFTEESEYGTFSYYTYDGELEGPNKDYPETHIICRNDDTVKMRLDLSKDKGELSYDINTTDILKDEVTHSFVLSDEIDVDKSYVMAVSFCDTCDSIQIIQS